MHANFLRADPHRELDGVTVRRVGKHAGGEALGASAYELAPAAQWAEVLHFHHANEELLLVVEGTPTVHGLDRLDDAHAAGGPPVMTRGAA